MYPFLIFSFGIPLEQCVMKGKKMPKLFTCLHCLLTVHIHSSLTNNLCKKSPFYIDKKIGYTLILDSCKLLFGYQTINCLVFARILLVLVQLQWTFRTEIYIKSAPNNSDETYYFWQSGPFWAVLTLL